MSRSKLNELCQRRSWGIPEYTTVKDGPAHIPRFKGIAVVNGLKFETSAECKSKKEAQNTVARIAFDYFNTTTPPLVHRQFSPSADPAVIQPLDPASSPAPVPQMQAVASVSQLPQIPVPVAPLPPPEAEINAKRIKCSPENKTTNLPDLPHQTSPLEGSSAQVEHQASTGPVAERSVEAPILGSASVMPYSDAPVPQMQAVSPVSQLPQIPVPVFPIPPPGIPSESWCKNWLQECAQRVSVPLPIYQTFTDGPQYPVRYRSHVLVDGIWYTSPHAFSSRKLAEQDVAKHAFIGFREKLKTEGYSRIHEDIAFCKAIINEYAVKMNMTTPTYLTDELKAYLPIFVSSLQLNGVTYTGDAVRNKKEAEQFAARTAISSILVHELGTAMSEIIKSKFKLYNALKTMKDSPGIQASPLQDSSNIQASTVKDSCNVPACIVKNSSCTPVCIVKDLSSTPTYMVNDSSNILACTVEDSSSIPACIIKDSASTPACFAQDSSNIQAGPVAAEVVPLDSALVSTSTQEVDVGVRAVRDVLATIQQPCFASFPSLQLAFSETASKQTSCSQSTHRSLHVLKNPKPISSVEAVTPPIVFGPLAIEQASESPFVCSTSGKKHPRNKKSGKKVLYQSPSTIVMVPQNQATAFSVTTQEVAQSLSL